MHDSHGIVHVPEDVHEAKIENDHQGCHDSDQEQYGNTTFDGTQGAGEDRVSQRIGYRRLKVLQQPATDMAIGLGFACEVGECPAPGAGHAFAGEHDVVATNFAWVAGDFHEIGSSAQVSDGSQLSPRCDLFLSESAGSRLAQGLVHLCGS